jgi:hypothetical protein
VSRSDVKDGGSAVRANAQREPGDGKGRAGADGRPDAGRAAQFRHRFPVPETPVSASMLIWDRLAGWGLLVTF